MSRWKEVNWDKWTLGHKIWHVIGVIVSLFACSLMLGAFAYLVLIYFGLLGFLTHIRDTILLNLMHSIFGSI